MVNDESGLTFSERRRRLLEERARKQGKTIEEISVVPPQGAKQPDTHESFRQDQVPDVIPERDPEAVELDRFMDKIDIVTAYEKWCSKSKPDSSGKSEGIKVSCPNPAHPDKDPSAWLNLDKGLWYCGGCAEGGDMYDIAAWRYGFPVPAYKSNGQFPHLRKKMAEDFGYQFQKVPGGHIAIAPEGNEPVKTDDSEPLATVTPLDPDLDDDEEDIVYPNINWKRIVPKDTFLWEYMEACTLDDSPEEYHFWHGLLALAHACGRKVVLDDTRPVNSNLLVCLLGGTGTGKSRSRHWLHAVVKEVMPYKETGLDTSGVRFSAPPGSGEYLIRTFSYERRDPTTNKPNGQFAPVNGIVDFDELANLVSRANRQGSTVKQVIMEFADANEIIQTGSLTHGTLIAEKPFCSIIASTQPKAVRGILNKMDTGSGFLNRWFFVGGPRKEREVIGGSHSSISVDLTKAAESLKQVHAWGGFERKLTVEPDALERMIEFWRKTVLPAIDKDQTDLLKRIDLLLKKLMLIFTINLKRDTVPLQAVDMCIEMWDYIMRCYQILDLNLGVTVQQESQDEILSIVRKVQAQTGRGASIRDIQRSKKKMTNDQIKKAIETLVALQLIQLAPKDTTKVGRPTLRYVAVND